MKVAVIDVGTLKIKFLIADIRPSGEFKTLYQSNTLTCLGVRMHENNNKPLPNNLRNTLMELKRCKILLEKEKVKKVRTVSTHALREMGNVGIRIADRIKKEINLEIEIISQKEEANLFFKAVTKDFTTRNDFTIVDVGGGSVQILIGNKNKLKDIHLLKTGAQYLFDNFSPRHNGGDFPTRREIRKMEKYIIQQIAPIPKNINTPIIYGSTCIIDLFKKIGLNMDKYDYSKSHPYKVNSEEIKYFLNKIIPIPYNKRERMFNFQQKYYMWGIDKAFLNILAISKRVNSPYIIPSNQNINNGLVQSFINN